MNDANCQPKTYKHSYLRSTLVLICVTVMVGAIFITRFLNMRFKEPEELSVNFHFLFVIVKNKMRRCCFPPWQILVIIGLTHALVIFRVIAAVLLANGSWEFLSNHSNTGAMMLGAVAHYLIITVMTRVGHPRASPLLKSAIGSQ